MDFVRRMVRAIDISVILYAVSAVSIFHILTSSYVLDPFIAFLFAGIVPGTDIVLAPEVVLMVLIDLFGLALCVFLVSWLIRRNSLRGEDYVTVAHNALKAPESLSRMQRALRRYEAAAAIRQTSRNTARAAASKAAAKTPAFLKKSSTKAVDIQIGRSVSTAVASVFWFFVTGILQVAQLILAAFIFAGQAIFLVAGAIVFAIRFVVAAIVAAVLRAMRFVVRIVTWVFVFSIVLIGTVIDQAIRALKVLWTRSQPGLQRADSWLELRYRAAVSFLYKRYKRQEALQIFVLVMKDSFANVRRLFK